MPLIIARDALQSRVVREVSTKQLGGVRRIQGIQNTEINVGPNGIQKVFGILNGAKNFLVGLVKFAIGFRGFSISELIGFFVQAVITIWNFNWNITDKELDIAIQNQWTTFAGSVGGLVGSGLGYFTCGFLPALTTFTFNEALGVFLLQRIGEEFVDEMAGQLANVIRNGVNSFAATAFAFVYKNFRKLMKRKGSIARKLLGDRIIDQWGAEGSPVFSFAQVFEDFVESIPNPMIRAFVEEFSEEFFESCVEASYVLGSGYEEYMAQQKINNELVLGPERVIEVVPNRNVEGERIILVGNEKLLRNDLVHTMAQHQLMDGKDIGEITGQPLEDYLNTRPQSQRLVLQFYSVPEPPFQRKTTPKVKRATYAIPDVNRAKMDWAKIKEACGGANGFLAGKYLATARLDNGRQLQVYGATEKEAVQQIKKFATLSTAEILTIHTSKREKEFKAIEQPDLIPNSIQLYPAYATLYVKRVDLDQGRPNLDGKKRSERRYRIDLWRKEKPINVEQDIAAMFAGRELEF